MDSPTNALQTTLKGTFNAYIDMVIDTLRTGWCKGTASRDAKGEVCYMEQAVCFCFVGAAYKCCGVASHLAQKLCNKVQSKLKNKISLGTWNDSQDSIEPIIKMVESCKE